MLMKKAMQIVLEYSRPYVFGMIHVPALPGTPMNKLCIMEIIDQVKKETQIYAQANVVSGIKRLVEFKDGIIVENMHDLPYTRRPMGPEITSSMTLACQAVSETLGQRRKDMLLGVQILAGANKEALAVACCTADEGWIDGCAGDLLRYSRSINAESIAVITDIKKKHSSHAITGDITIGEVAEAAEFFLADGVVITGRCTGFPPDVKDIKGAKLPDKFDISVCGPK
ncbi:BtpA family protein [Dictyocaulus viviparus]|uniref:BtpA family protein n=1 Tax=Dictyocaulus viviparus TaxID=29172 RepID=A0A0D8XAJ7_DICVI|nr:BtpA family protein [Dictyocaulus viviparus]